jgi:hypothetical protein
MLPETLDEERVACEAGATFTGRARRCGASEKAYKSAMIDAHGIEWWESMKSRNHTRAALNRAAIGAGGGGKVVHPLSRAQAEWVADEWRAGRPYTDISASLGMAASTLRRRLDEWGVRPLR